MAETGKQGRLDTSKPPAPEDFDFVRFTYSDTHGIARGRNVPRRNVKSFMENGAGIFSAIMTMSSASELCFGAPGTDDIGWPNVNAMADISTLHLVPWAGYGKYNVGEFLCETKHADGSPQVQCPRYQARLQLDRLKEQGYKLYSAFECEMMVQEADTGKKLWEARGYNTQLNLSRSEKLLLEVDELLALAGVDVASYQAEYELGQMEMPLMPKYGIKSADETFIFRNGFQEICDKRNYKVFFLTKTIAGGVCNGFHFNHSVCSIKDDKNVFGDESNDLSEFIKKWIAGLVKHSNALCALVCPRVNCYRRLHRPWAPHKATWGVDNRISTYRIKKSSSSPPYIENRLPSGSCNPYLVVAATVAAGLDGVLNCSPDQCPPEMDPSATELPHSLEEALVALENDQVMVTALGEDFVRWFAQSKRTTEIEKLPDSDMNVDSQEAIDKEIAVYGNIM